MLQVPYTLLSLSAWAGSEETHLQAYETVRRQSFAAIGCWTQTTCKNRYGVAPKTELDIALLEAAIAVA